jgi:Tfp pilus assembly protein PilO
MPIKIKNLKEKIKDLLALLQSLPKEKIILGVLLILLIGFLLYQSLLTVQIARLKAVDFQFSSQKNLFDFYNRLLKDAEILIGDVRERESNFTQIKKKFVAEEELSNYFASLRAMAKSHNLKVLGLDFKPQEAITNLTGGPLTYYWRLPFELSLKGDYFNIMYLLYNLEQGNTLFDIQSMRIKKESPDTQEIALEMEAVVYILMKKI